MWPTGRGLAGPDNKVREMIKLKKATPTQWNGNGLGTDSAEWVIKKAPHIAVRQFAGRWVAIDQNQNWLQYSFTKKGLLEKLADQYPEFI